MKIDRHNLSKETLGRLLDEIHDRWFDLRTLPRGVSGEVYGEWLLPFAEGKRTRCCKWLFGGWEIVRPPQEPYDHVLSVTGVYNVSYRHTETVRFCTINELQVDPEKLIVTITAEPDVTMTLEVDRDFTISVE